MPHKVLYVDDNDAVRGVAEMCLQVSEELTVRTCSSGGEAIDISLEWKPDLVLMDVMMPGIDGITAFKMMRERSEIKNINLVFVTARVQKEEIEQYLALGAAGVIEKPFVPMDLADQALSFIGLRPDRKIP
jgi:two-component system, OmpR family, response regulator